MKLFNNLDNLGTLSPQIIPPIHPDADTCVYSAGLPAKKANFNQYEHHYPDTRQVQLANIYPDDLLALFRKWLHSTYIPDKFPAYVREICSAEECLLVAQAIGFEVKPKRSNIMSGSIGVLLETD